MSPHHWACRTLQAAIILAATTVSLSLVAADGLSRPAVTDDAAQEDDELNRDPSDERLPSAPAPADALQSVVTGMRDAQQRIAKQEIGEPTRKVQQRVVDELDRLIALARQMQPPSAPSSSNPSRERDQKPDEQDSEAREGDAAGDPGRKDRTDAQDSDARTGKGDEKPVELWHQRHMVNQVWGHLPEHLRLRLQNVSSDKTLPDYEELVNRYFEALAEQGRAPGAK